MRHHASVTTTEKYYVGIQSDEDFALLAGLMGDKVNEGEPKKQTAQKEEKVIKTKKGFPIYSGTPKLFSMRALGLEPRTYGLKVRCSTN